MEIKINQLTKQIKGVTVLEDITLTMQGGKIYGLKGPNGCGKTMLMRAISGLILPSSGSVEIDGQELGKDISFPPSIGLLIEYPSFVNGYTGLKNLQMIASIQNKITEEQVREAIQRVGLNPDDKRTFKKYSLGMKQKLGIACAIMENPELIILDEPVNALDEAGISMVRDILHDYRKKGALIIIACHDKEELEFLSDEIYSISEGKITGHDVLPGDDSK